MFWNGSLSDSVLDRQSKSNRPKWIFDQNERFAFTALYEYSTTQQILSVHNRNSRLDLWRVIICQSLLALTHPLLESPHPPPITLACLTRSLVVQKCHSGWRGNSVQAHWLVRFGFLHLAWQCPSGWTERAILVSVGRKILTVGFKNKSNILDKVQIHP